MRKMDGHIENEEVRQICRAINRRADDHEQLQMLVVRLQEVLRAEIPRQQRSEIRAPKTMLQPDDPFDKIMVV